MIGKRAILSRNQKREILSNLITQASGFMMMMIPLKVPVKDDKNDKITKWENQVINAASYFRLVYLSREKEDDEVLLNLVIKTTDKSRSNLNSDGIEINMNNEKFLVEGEIIDAMKDLKLKKKKWYWRSRLLALQIKASLLNQPNS